MRAVLLVACLAGGCFNPAPSPGAPCGDEGQCPSGLTCTNGTCELPTTAGDGGIDTAADACVQTTCEGDDLVGCGMRISCAGGCSLEGDPHCRQFVPANGLTPALLVGATASVGGDKWDFDTDTGRIRGPMNVELRPEGVDTVIDGIGFFIVDNMGVFTAETFTVLVEESWEAAGSNALVLYAHGAITIEGSIDVGAQFSQGGPDGSDGTTSTGASSQCRGRAGRYFAPRFGEGGGGGGGRTAGGDGAPSNMDTANFTGVGGPVCTSQATTQPLDGGAGGGAASATFSNEGGGGGGAIALVSMTSVVVMATGIVGAPGDGGESGSGTSPSGDGGGGGGGGGAILLDAPFVTVTGHLTANGGGGGAPFSVDGQRGSMTSATPAPGGTYTGPGGTRRGGDGGAGTTAPTNGQTYFYDDGLATTTSVTSRGGGGGGAAGRIELRATTLDTTGALLSPPAVSSQPTYQ